MLNSMPPFSRSLESIDQLALPCPYADSIRNSSAHAQSTLTGEGENIGMAITNTRDGTSVNFDIVMDLLDF
jgi:hypothetical protein